MDRVVQDMVYDQDAAEEFIALRCGITRSDAASFVNARYWYCIITDLTDPANEDEEREAEMLLEKHHDLIPDEANTEDLDLLAEFVRRLTKLPIETIAGMIAEETAYLIQMKAMEPAAYNDYREWANEVAERAAAVN